MESRPFALIAPLSTLFVGIAILLVGTGLLGIVLQTRAFLAGFPNSVTGVIMSAYFLGFVMGTFGLPAVIRRVGHIRTFAAVTAVASATALAHGILVDPVIWAGLRCITGICTVGFFMVIESWINTRTPNDHRGQVLAVYMIQDGCTMILLRRLESSNLWIDHQYTCVVGHGV